MIEIDPIFDVDINIESLIFSELLKRIYDFLILKENRNSLLFKPNIVLEFKNDIISKFNTFSDIFIVLLYLSQNRIQFLDIIGDLEEDLIAFFIAKIDLYLNTEQLEFNDLVDNSNEFNKGKEENLIKENKIKINDLRRKTTHLLNDINLKNIVQVNVMKNIFSKSEKNSDISYNSKDQEEDKSLSFESECIDENEILKDDVNKESTDNKGFESLLKSDENDEKNNRNTILLDLNFSKNNNNLTDKIYNKSLKKDKDESKLINSNKENLQQEYSTFIRKNDKFIVNKQEKEELECKLEVSNLNQELNLIKSQNLQLHKDKEDLKEKIQQLFSQLELYEKEKKDNSLIENSILSGTLLIDDLKRQLALKEWELHEKEKLVEKLKFDNIEIQNFNAQEIFDLKSSFRSQEQLISENNFLKEKMKNFNELKDQLEEFKLTKNSVIQLNRENANLKKKNNSINNKYDNVLLECNKYKTEISSLKRKVEDYEKEILNLKWKINEAYKSISHNTSNINEKQTSLGLIVGRRKLQGNIRQDNRCNSSINKKLNFENFVSKLEEQYFIHKTDNFNGDNDNSFSDSSDSNNKSENLNKHEPELEDSILNQLKHNNLESFKNGHMQRLSNLNDLSDIVLSRLSISNDVIKNDISIPKKTEKPIQILKAEKKKLELNTLDTPKPYTVTYNLKDVNLLSSRKNNKISYDYNSILVMEINDSLELISSESYEKTKLKNDILELKNKMIMLSASNYDLMKKEEALKKEITEYQKSNDNNSINPESLNVSNQNNKINIFNKNLEEKIKVDKLNEELNQIILEKEKSINELTLKIEYLNKELNEKKHNFKSENKFEIDNQILDKVIIDKNNRKNDINITEIELKLSKVNEDYNNSLTTIKTLSIEIEKIKEENRNIKLSLLEKEQHLTLLNEERNIELNENSNKLRLEINSLNEKLSKLDDNLKENEIERIKMKNLMQNDKNKIKELENVIEKQKNIFLCDLRSKQKEIEKLLEEKLTEKSKSNKINEYLLKTINDKK